MDDQQRLTVLLDALDGDLDNAVFFTVHGNPHPKGRPRHGNGRTYTDPKDEFAEARTAAVMRHHVRRPFTGDVAIACLFFRKNRQVVDVDNLLKHVMDAGNGPMLGKTRLPILWADDRQVTDQATKLRVDREAPRTVIGLAPVRAAA